MKAVHLSFLLCAAGLSLAAQAAPGTLTRAADLKAKPFVDAATLTQLPEQTKVDILGNEGGWSQIKSPQGQTGWVRLLHVRPDSASSGNALSSLGTLGNVARTGSSGATATTGAKGISKDDLAQAAPSPQEVKRLTQYASNRQSAEQHARSNRLQKRNMAYLDPADGKRN